MLVILLLACGLWVSEAIVCPPNICSTMKCADVSNCQGTVQTKGGFCGCCDTCLTLLGESHTCLPDILMGVPSHFQCGPGLICDPKTHTCTRPIINRQAAAVGKCALKQLELNKGVSSGGLPLLGRQQLRCNPDGSYNPVQCMGSVCYCVDTDGVEIQGYRTNMGQSAHKNCQCARDKTEYILSGLIGRLFNCESNGNYQQYRCVGSVCYCVDDNGNKND